MKTNLLNIDLSRMSSCSLQDLERVIEISYIKAGQALQYIKSKKLYKSSYRTYDEYCSERWGFTPQHANRLISAAKLVDQMKKSEPIGSVLPQSESQVRALSKTDDPTSAWKESQQKTGKKQPSAKEITMVTQKTEGNVIDAEIVESRSDPKDAFWASFSNLLDHPYEFGDTSGRKQIAINTDNDSVERLEKLRSMTGHTKGEIVSQALCLLEEMMTLKNREISSQK